MKPKARQATAKVPKKFEPTKSEHHHIAKIYEAIESEDLNTAWSF